LGSKTTNKNYHIFHNASQGAKVGTDTITIACIFANAIILPQKANVAVLVLATVLGW